MLGILLLNVSKRDFQTWSRGLDSWEKNQGAGGACGEMGRTDKTSFRKSNLILVKKKSGVGEIFDVLFFQAELLG